MRLRTTLLVAFLLSGCARPPAENDIEARYYEAPEVYAEILENITRDAKGKTDFTVGVDELGWYLKRKDGWVYSKPTLEGRMPQVEDEYTLDEVLKIVGFTNQQYEEYVSLLKRIGATRIFYARDSMYWGRHLSIDVYRNGMTFPSCRGRIEFFEKGKVPTSTGNREDRVYVEVKELGNKWYSIVDCA